MNLSLSILVDLWTKTLGFQIAIPLLAVCYIAFYTLKMYQTPPGSLTLRSSRSTSIFASLLQFGGLFVALGLLIQLPSFYVMFVAYFIQFLVYIFGSVMFLGTKTPRFCCSKNITNSRILRILIVIQHILLGVLSTAAVLLAGADVSPETIHQYQNSKSFENCYKCLVGGTFYIVMIHFIGGIEEAIWYLVWIKRDESIGQRRKVIVWEDSNGIITEYSYDQSSENIAWLSLNKTLHHLFYIH
ncbi:Transmembrane domain-containing protein [Spironucleus salmonicida]|uniref:Transmembrane domain-containing protein n=1 Tax=Spironucleus salmonicida TaxID=348837 RepID=V6LY24_9EUKA|nr:Transmembrane domain-containing protein [Spironucleus salmonicida]|eukprot:EST49552.1 Transmembrane domain-containing protein [Spironucleus salmonicida]